MLRTRAIWFICALAVLWCVGAAAFAQAPAGPTFDVASIKPSTSASLDGAFRVSPGRFTVEHLSLREIIRFAFDVRPFQMAGAPGWSESTIYDINAVMPADADRDEGRVRVMLQNLLTERFQLRVHREQRELPMYALVLARKDGALGPQLMPSQTDCVRWRAENPPQPGRIPADCSGLTSRSRIRGSSTTMPQLARSLENLVERPVADRTGLQGGFTFDVRWMLTGEPTLGSVAVGAADLGSLLTALEEQLGLKLQATRGPVDVVVIDHVERPSEN